MIFVQGKCKDGCEASPTLTTNKLGASEYYLFSVVSLLSVVIFLNLYACSGNPKDEPGAVVCRVAQSFLRFGSYQIHATRGKEDLEIVRSLADYTIRHHFSHIENMSLSDSLSFSTGEEDSSVVDLTSNKYAGESILIWKSISVQV